MSHSGEPGHDDYGLPRVDIQIPDDARELDRDVQAYHRELRALRRHERSLRWRAPLRRSGMIVPLIAGCLVLAMVAGMVLTMFSANPYFGGFSGQRASSQKHQSIRNTRQPASSASAAPSATRNRSGVPGTPLTHLPKGTMSVAGQRVDLSTVKGAALAIIPVSCRCATAIRRLVDQAMAAGIVVYLVGKRGNQTQLSRLAPDAAKGTAFVAIDTDNALNNAYPAKALTVVLVDSQHNVRRASALRPGFQLQSALKQLGGTR